MNPVHSDSKRTFTTRRFDGEFRHDTKQGEGPLGLAVLWRPKGSSLHLKQPQLEHPEPR